MLWQSLDVQEMNNKTLFKKIDTALRDNGNNAARETIDAAEENAFSMGLEDHTEKFWTATRASLSDAIEDGHTDFFTDVFTSREEIANAINAAAEIKIV